MMWRCSARVGGNPAELELETDWGDEPQNMEVSTAEPGGGNPAGEASAGLMELEAMDLDYQPPSVAPVASIQAPSTVSAASTAPEEVNIQAVRELAEQAAAMVPTPPAGFNSQPREGVSGPHRRSRWGVPENREQRGLPRQ